MLNLKLVPEENSYPAYFQTIQKSLDDLTIRMEKELAAKQNLIEQQQLEIQELKALIKNKDTVIEELTSKTVELQRGMEGNRQMIKKLINDVVRKQQDIEWYKRTYETRSLLGTLKEKIFGKNL